MKEKKKMLALFLMLLLSVSLFVNVGATEVDETQSDIYYFVCDDNGNMVEDGFIPRNNNLRYHWSPNITLANGWFTSFCLPDRSAFYVTSNTSMCFSYSLNRNAKIQYQFMKSSQRSITNASIWRTGTVTAQSASVYFTSDSTAYYYVGITNASSDPITITSVDFVF